MQRHNKLASNVDLAELAARSRNFSGAELEGLVRSAQATAMNRIIKACSDSREGRSVCGWVISFS